MMQPVVAMSPLASLHVMKALIVIEPDPGPITYKPKYKRDKARRKPWGKRDFWQPSALTDELREGDCEDWLRRYASHEARRRAIWLCVSNVGPATWHYYARLEDGSIVDWCRQGGMGPVTYGIDEKRVRIAPEDFGMRMDHVEEGAGRRKVTYDQFSKELDLSKSIVGAIGAVVSVAYPPAAPAVAPLVAGYAGVTAAIDASVKAKVQAARKKKNRPSKPVTKQRVRLLFHPQTAPKIASAAQKRGFDVSADAIEKAQEMSALIIAADHSEKANGILMQVLAEAPIRIEKGKPVVNERAVMARLAAAHKLLTFQNPGNLDMQKLFGDEEPANGAGDGQACCDACAAGEPCTGAGDVVDEPGDDEDGAGDDAFLDEFADGAGDAGDEIGDDEDGAGDDAFLDEFADGAGDVADEIANQWLARMEGGAGCARGCPVR